MNVYVLMKDDGTIFYVGAGNDRRISNHMNGIGGRPLVNDVIAEHRARGSDISSKIVSKHKTKDEAFAAEIELISKIKRICDGGTLVNVSTGGPGVNGFKQSPEQVAENSRRSKERFKLESERAKTSEATKKAMQCPELRKRIGIKLLEKWKDPSFRENQVIKHTGKKDSEETIKNKAASCSKSWHEGKRLGMYTDEQIMKVYSLKGKEKACDVAKIYGMNTTYVHKIWRHERCRMALIRIGIITTTEGL